MKLVAYLSGPMTGRADFNYHEFYRVARAWRKLNWHVINPAENFGGDQTLSKERYMRHDLAQLMTCDAIVMLPGWKRSRGAKLEHAVAQAIGLNIFFEQDRDTGADVEPARTDADDRTQYARTLLADFRRAKAR